MRLVQIVHPKLGRKVALVKEPSLVLLNNFTSIYELSLHAITSETGLPGIVNDHLSGLQIDYDLVYESAGEWTLLPSFDLPGNPFGCIVSGTGLTHKNSALNRQMMHVGKEDKLTDSMKMYQWGIEGGQPAKDRIGKQPEWFYKGTGAALRAHGQVLTVPEYANDGGEEPEIAGVYVVDNNGQPYRIGFTTGNEFSDHVMERQNYLYLAPSKLRTCSIGPELVIGHDFSDIKGVVQVIRDDSIIWSAQINTGERNMAHSLSNLEYHHFKYADHCQPMQAHVHFFGADAFSFGAGIELKTGDKTVVEWKGMGRPLVNTIHVTEKVERLKTVKTL